MKTLLLLLACVLAGSAFAQNTQNELKGLKTVLEETHIAPRTIDDAFSRDVFRRFIKIVDSRGLLLTQQEYALLKQYETSLDDEYQKGELTFLQAFLPIYKKRLLAHQEAIQRMTDKPLDFTKKEALVAVEGKRDTIFHLANEQESYKIQERLIKYACLLRYEAQGKEKKADLPTFVPQVRKTELRRIKRILEHAEGFEQYITNRYLLAVAICYDPHSYYMNLTSVQGFMSGLTSQGLSFGINLMENEQDEIVIDQLIPGGSAWNSNKLHVGDVLLSIQWEGKEAIDLVGAGVEEAYAVIEQSNKGKAFFVFRQKDGATDTIKLAKTVTRQDENTIKCFVIQGKKKIGYISLPAFYQGCARDVGSAIVKMKKEGIEGLIMDIRDNGGGSMDEGNELAGIFIDQGALMIVNSRQNKPTIIKDPNRGTMFDAPMLVMINRNSASASEIFSSTLQDYHRALIVGSKTYGKSTGQGIVPINKENPKTGFAKITQIKIYRVNGRTAQFVGVEPDIEMIDDSEVDFMRESDAPHALKPDTVNKKVLFVPLPLIPIEDLRQKHLGRMTPSNGLYKIMQAIRKIKDAQQDVYKQIPIDKEGFLKWRADLEANLPQEVDFAKDLPTLQANSLQADAVWLAQDEYAKEMHQNILDSLKKDVHVAECYQILLDWIAML